MANFADVTIDADKSRCDRTRCTRTRQLRLGVFLLVLVRATPDRPYYPGRAGGLDTNAIGPVDCTNAAIACTPQLRATFLVFIIAAGCGDSKGYRGIDRASRLPCRVASPSWKSTNGSTISMTRYCHGRMDRRQFLARAASLSVIGRLAMAQALLPALMRRHQTVSFTDPRIKASTWGTCHVMELRLPCRATWCDQLGRDRGRRCWSCENRPESHISRDVARRMAIEGFSHLRRTACFRQAAIGQRRRRSCAAKAVKIEIACRPAAATFKPWLVTEKLIVTGSVSAAVSSTG